MSIKVRGHTSPSEGLESEECPLLTLKPGGHISPSDGLKPEECPLLTLKPGGHISPSDGLKPEKCPLLTLKPEGHISPPDGLKSEVCSLLTLKSGEHNGAFIDMHTHSTASDGSMTPAELVRYGFESGLAAIAVTDHDTMSGIKQAIDEGNRLGIEVIPGVEISVSFKPEMHLLGYFFNNNYNPILKTLEDLREKREQRNPKIIKRLNEMGFDISLSEVEQVTPGGIVGRPHIARVLMNKGYVSSIAEAFEKYLASGRPAYFKKDKLTPEEGISAIAEAGGVPVLAHPIFLDMNYEQLDKLFGQLAGYGLKGVEALYTENTEVQTKQLLQLVQKHNLLVTGGSDFHGSFKPDIDIGKGRGGLKVPYSLLEKLRHTQ